MRQERLQEAFVTDQDFLTIILETEEKTDAMVAEAQVKARQRLEDTRAEAENRVIVARKQSEEMVRQILERAQNMANGKDSESIAATVIQIQNLRQDVAASLDKAVQIVAERIVK